MRRHLQFQSLSPHFKGVGKESIIKELRHLVEYALNSNYDDFDNVLLPEVYLERLRLKKRIGKIGAPLVIGWVITYKCNGDCMHCWSAKGKEEVTIENAKKFIAQIKELNIPRVILSGGEPFLHPYLLDIVKMLKKTNSNISIYTNGSLLDNSMVRKLRTNLFNYDLIQVSLDGDTPETYYLQRRRHFFERVISGIKRLVEDGINVRVHFVATPLNITSIFNTYKLSASLKVNSFVVSKVYPRGMGTSLAEKVNEDEFLDQVIRCIDFKVRNKCTTALKVFFPFRFIQYTYKYYDRIKDLIPKRDLNYLVYPKGGNSMVVIDPNGNVFPGHGFTDQEFNGGNVFEIPLRSIWHNTESWEILRRGIDFSQKCKECKVWPLCEGFDYSKIYEKEKQDKRCRKYH